MNKVLFLPSCISSSFDGISLILRFIPIILLIAGSSASYGMSDFKKRWSLVPAFFQANKPVSVLPPRVLIPIEQQWREHQDSLKKGYDQFRQAFAEQGESLGMQETFKGYTPLMLAIWNRNQMAAQSLVRQSLVDPNAKGPGGWTALMIAVKMLDVDMVRFLLDSRADVNQANDEALTPIMIAVAQYDSEASQESDIYKIQEEMLNLLIEHGANLQAVDSLENQVLNYARGQLGDRLFHKIRSSNDLKERQKGTDQIRKEVVQKEEAAPEVGETVIQPDYSYEQGLIGNIQSGNCLAAQMLINCFGVGDERTKEGKTALHIAVEYGAADLVSLLLEKGASIDERDNNGQTALHSAAACGNEKIVKMLQEKGASVTIKDHKGNTPADIAQHNEHKNVVKFLKSAKFGQEKKSKGSLFRELTLRAKKVSDLVK